MRAALRNRLTFAGLLLAALPFVICAVTRHQIAFETSLNLLWVSLACGAFVHWRAGGNRRRSAHSSGPVALVFILSLLFPVISANDDLAQLDLINDAKTAQCIIISVKSDKQLRGGAGVVGLPVPAVKVSSPLAPTSEIVLESFHAASVATSGNATGNHSPPLR